MFSLLRISVFLIFYFSVVKFAHTLSVPPNVNLPRNFSWPDKVQQYSGYINVNKTYGNHFFYWFFESRNHPSTDPLILWLTGGPGCASSLALLVENGPFKVNTHTGELFYNQYGWNSFANLLYVDQPVGTGFSYTDNPLGFETDESIIARELTTFMEEFYRKYPKYSKLPFYIIGESYAGHYIPPFSANILRNSPELKANLKGIALGDAWVNPIVQYVSFLDYMYDIDFITQSSYKFIDETLRKPCIKILEQGTGIVSDFECEAYIQTLMLTAEAHMKRSINSYDVRIPCVEPPVCYNFSAITLFLNRKDVQAALGAHRKWDFCSVLPNVVLVLDENKAYETDVAFILSQNVRVLVYSGKDDFICNYMGGKAWTESMEWPGKSEFSQKSLTNWVYNDVKVGEAKTAKNLTLLFVENAGHMVPMDLPEISLAIVRNFLSNKPF